MAKKTISMRQLRRESEAEYRKRPWKTQGSEAILTADRPRTRGDCERVPRPCPWLGCRYNLGLEVNPMGGIRFGPDPDSTYYPSCALDEAAQGPRCLEDIGTMFGLTRERIRQEEERALENLRAAQVLQDSPAGGLTEETEYTQAPMDESLDALGLNKRGDTAWLKKILNSWDTEDETP